MNELTRKTLDWFELPFAVVWLLFLGKERKKRAIEFYEKNPEHWRKHTIPFKVMKYILDKSN